jgi:hypothetical protein
LKSGVVAIFGPESGTTSSHVQSICDAMEIPHIETRWDYLTNKDDYSINLYPSPRQISKVSLRTYALQNKFNPNPDGYKKMHSREAGSHI